MKNISHKEKMLQKKYLSVLMCVFVLAVMLLGLANCGGKRPAAQYHVIQTFSGKASWYGAKFHGRKTASGERFNMHAMTAAHKTLPFGTILLVKNLQNNKVVKVRVNDRGPFVRGRVIDLSHAAAKKLDMIRAGSANVVVKVLR